jgi:hypothetical protein
MEAAADARLGAVDPVDAAYRERQRPAQLGDREPAAGVADCGMSTSWTKDEVIGLE